MALWPKYASLLCFFAFCIRELIIFTFTEINFKRLSISNFSPKSFSQIQLYNTIILRGHVDET